MQERDVRRMAIMGEMRHDIFHHHDGSIDQHPDRNGETSQTIKLADIPA